MKTCCTYQAQTLNTLCTRGIHLARVTQSQTSNAYHQHLAQTLDMLMRYSTWTKVFATYTRSKHFTSFALYAFA